jgi:hypothetical protein
MQPTTESSQEKNLLPALHFLLLLPAGSLIMTAGFFKQVPRRVELRATA